MTEAEYFEWLKGDGQFAEAKPMGDGLYAGIKPLLFHWTMIVGEIGDCFGYTDRWCYQNEAFARAALAAWDGEGEPQGWHRHPDSGRRRPNGNPELEYVNP